MGLRRFVLSFLLWIPLAGCGGQGTEVLNPPNPGEIQTVKTDFISAQYEIQLEVPSGWAYTEYGPGNQNLRSDVFRDIDPATFVVAHFTKGDTRFTVFFSVLKTGQTLYDFVRERHPTGDIKVEPIPDEINAFSAILTPADPGPRGGSMIEVYVSVENECVWVKAELVGTSDEKNELLKEFSKIVDSVVFIPKV